MKKYLIGAAAGLLLLLSACGAQAKGDAAAILPWPTEPVTLYVSSDLHWQDTEREGASALIEQMVYLEEIIDTLMDETAQGKPAALILCGDLTNSGSAGEHEALALRFARAEAAGVPIFVTMGNHDMDRGEAPADLVEQYTDFGFRDALSRDANSMSYLAPINGALWLLSLDCNVYGDKESEFAGTISDATLGWVKDCLNRADQAGAMVVPFSHHNLLVHTLDGRGDNYNIDQGGALADLLLDYGVPVYLSGHRHNSFVVPLERDGRRLDELVSDMPAAYPHRYTTLTLLPDSTIRYSVPSLDVDGWAERSGRTESELLHFADYSAAIAAKRMGESGGSVAAKLAPNAEIRAEMERFYADFYTNYQNHNLWQVGDKLRADPALALWQHYGAENIYGRWMPWILQNQRNDKPEQILGPYR